MAEREEDVDVAEVEEALLMETQANTFNVETQDGDSFVETQRDTQLGTQEDTRAETQGDTNSETQHDKDTRKNKNYPPDYLINQLPGALPACHKECFMSNHVDGRRLILINCSSLPRLGVTDFNHMNELCRGVRALLGVREPPFTRSIYEPRREPWGLYLEARARSGAQADSLTFEQFVQGQLYAKME
ncbi:sterile alpha motif domain-containing protein 15 [Lampetra fluviatilis]